jgi:hypothetical protein
MDSRKPVTLNELICELAYGRRMKYAEMAAYERDNNCAPANSKRRGWFEGDGSRDLSGGINVYAGGVTYVDPEYDGRTGGRTGERGEEASRSAAYCKARDFIFGLAEAGTICIYARSPREDRRDSDYPPISANYRSVPKEAFMTEHLFAPDDLPVLWPKEGCSVQDAEWFYPIVNTRDAAKILSLWPARSVGSVALQNLEPRELPSGYGVSQRKVDAALRVVSKQYEDSGIRPKEGPLLAAVRKIEPNTALQQLRDARREGVIPDTWLKVGRPKKLRKKTPQKLIT